MACFWLKVVGERVLGEENAEVRVLLEKILRAMGQMGQAAGRRFHPREAPKNRRQPNS
jgi:hypothetical protein